MNYANITSPESTERQRSLFAILDEAIEGAAQWQTPIYVIHAPVYVDEHADRSVQHVWASKEAALIMYPKPKTDKLEWNIDARIEPDGEVFLTRIEDSLLMISVNQSGRPKASTKLKPKEGEQGTLALHGAESDVEDLRNDR